MLYIFGACLKVSEDWKNTFYFHRVWTVLVLSFSHRISPGMSVQVCHRFASGLDLHKRVSHERSWN